MSNGASEPGQESRSILPRMPANPPSIGAAEEFPAPARGPVGPSTQVAGRDEAPAPSLDNYAQFIERLQAAEAKLTPRRDTLSTALDAGELLFSQNQTGAELWGQRRSRIRQTLETHATNARTRKSLSELHDVALKMEQMFSTRAQRVQHVCIGIRDRRDQINVSLFELDKSKVKLAASRRLAQERENLRKVAEDLSVTAENLSFGVPDPGLRDSLREAREAIILAEALLEVKGN